MLTKFAERLPIQLCSGVFLHLMHPIIPLEVSSNMAEEPTKALLSSIAIEDDLEPSVTREICGFLRIC